MRPIQTNDELLTALPSDTRLAGQTAIVTGSTSGIGEAIARVLAASGAEVVVSGRDVARAQRVVDTIVAAGGRAHAVPADLSGPSEDVRSFARAATAQLGGRVDILVNNAGVYPVTPTEALPDGDLEALLATNIRAPHVLVAAIAPAMAERGSGAIVNIGSWMGRVGTSSGAMYTASKAATEQLTRTPGNAEFGAVLDAMTSGTAAGRPVRPIDIAYGVRFLVSEEALFVHGAVLDIDGGMLGTRLKF